MHAACPALDSAAAPSPCHNRPLTVPRAQSRPRIRARGARAARASLPRRAAAAASCAPSPSRAIVAIVAGARLASPSPSYTAAAALSPRALPPASSLHPPPALVALPGRRHATLAVLPPRHRHRRRPEPGPIPVVYEHDGRRRPAVWERALPAALTLPVPHAHVNEQPGMGYVPVLRAWDAARGRRGPTRTQPAQATTRNKAVQSTGCARRRRVAFRKGAGERELGHEPPAYVAGQGTSNQWHMHTVSPSRLNAAAAPYSYCFEWGAQRAARDCEQRGPSPMLPAASAPAASPSALQCWRRPLASERLLAATASNAITGPRRRRFERTHRANASSALATRPVPHAQCPPRIRG
ncbi:hypothetical protein B0H15DRAFT_998697 [Mycena belliarum]|uniref:Uncharacterized protein n=1 Tax=Mycena belliarum TaxID=1033014 RepID=A0AAD6XZX2_9AGAR|nr:hypothetical protein B0H15DRAFT_998692 [Mycena belliae]KAJ7099990.1 hypothetical protein B0H15DRAFT_998697 [Mycena belliae]